MTPPASGCTSTGQVRRHAAAVVQDGLRRGEGAHRSETSTFSLCETPSSSLESAAAISSGLRRLSCAGSRRLARRALDAPDAQRIHQSRACLDRLQNGVEALVDLYLLAECDYLVGDSTSAFAKVAGLLSAAPASRRYDTAPSHRVCSTYDTVRWSRARLARQLWLSGRAQEPPETLRGGPSAARTLSGSGLEASQTRSQCDGGVSRRCFYVSAPLERAPQAFERGRAQEEGGASSVHQGGDIYSGTP